MNNARPGTSYPVRARQVLRAPRLWVIPLAVVSVVVGLMTAFYISSVVDPLAHLRGLPVVIVNEDGGASAGTHRLDIGQQVQAALTASRAVTGRLQITSADWSAAKAIMDRNGAYVTVVIPAGFTGALLAESGLAAPRSTPGRPEIDIMASQRAGTMGVTLATDVLEPALGAASQQIGRQLLALVPAGAASPVTRALLSDPAAVTASQYRPLPAHSALGLSAFYIALITLLCGFLVGAIVNSAVDAATGYASTEIGPRWDQRQPLPINRWQTLLVKWAMAAVLTAAGTGIALGVAAGALRMDAPDPVALWLFMWLCSASVAAGTITAFAVLGTYGLLVAMLVFVYFGLASAGGTVPVEALPGFLRAVSPVDPLRAILAGTRSILYFNAQADAGLTRGVLTAALGLVLWLGLGTAVVRWYDHRGLQRMRPELFAYVSGAVQDYRAGHAGPSANHDEVAPAGQAATSPNEPDANAQQDARAEQDTRAEQ